MEYAVIRPAQMRVLLAVKEEPGSSFALFSVAAGISSSRASALLWEVGKLGLIVINVNRRRITAIPKRGAPDASLDPTQEAILEWLKGHPRSTITGIDILTYSRIETLRQLKSLEKYGFVVSARINGVKEISLPQGTNGKPYRLL